MTKEITYIRIWLEPELQRTEMINRERTTMVWPTLRSRMAKEQDRTCLLIYTHSITRSQSLCIYFIPNHGFIPKVPQNICSNLLSTTARSASDSFTFKWPHHFKCFHFYLLTAGIWAAYLFNGGLSVVTAIFVQRLGCLRSLLWWTGRQLFLLHTYTPAVCLHPLRSSWKLTSHPADCGQWQLHAPHLSHPTQHRRHVPLA